MKGQFLVVSGPSGSGKSTLISRLLKENLDLYFSISCTTRAPRDGEIDGVNYHFVSKDEFKSGIDDGEFLEWALVHDNYYGTSFKKCLNACDDGKIVLFDIDVQGYRAVKDKFSDITTSVFITTSSKSELKSRLFARNTDDKNSILNRLDNATSEMKHINLYDYFLCNDDLNRCYFELNSILESMRHKTQTLNLNKIINNW
ncbi:MAG: guanylate kinase [Campylobacter sp.]|nr:guanylate kinase [Campylobacter sp.]